MQIITQQQSNIRYPEPVWSIMSGMLGHRKFIANKEAELLRLQQEHLANEVRSLRSLKEVIGSYPEMTTNLLEYAKQNELLGVQEIPLDESYKLKVLVADDFRNVEIIDVFENKQ